MLNEKVPNDAKYYSREYKRSGRNHFHFIRFYNADFEKIEDANSSMFYTKQLDHLIRIVKNPSMVHKLSYDLIELSNGFYAVKEDENTLKALVAIAKSVARN